MSKIFENDRHVSLGRRLFFSDVGKATLSASAVALIAGCDSMAARQTTQMPSDPMQDVAILNVALGLEHQAIGAYQLGAESGLLQPAVLTTAVLFQTHHKEHRDGLESTIRKLGGTPVESKTLQAYAQELDAAAIKNQTDILMLAHRLEKEAADAYLGVIPSFQDGALSEMGGRVACDEAMHWTVLQQALGMPLPAHSLSFGA